MDEFKYPKSCVFHIFEIRQMDIFEFHSLKSNKVQDEQEGKDLYTISDFAQLWKNAI